MKRLFITGVMHETNGFSPIPTARDSFNRHYWDPKVETEPKPHLDMLGYGAVRERANEHGFIVVPSLFAAAWPAAPVSLADWHTLRDRIIADLHEAGPIDAVFLFLHGAMFAQGVDDCEGDLIAAVRTEVGPTVPVAAEYDLHGNVGVQMVENADFTVACREYPHVDHVERSLHAVALLARVLRGEPRGATVALRIPLVGLFPTIDSPMSELVVLLREVEARPGVLAASVFHGFFAADVPDMGASVVVHADYADLARAVADELAAAFVRLALAMPQRANDIGQALDAAMADGARPVVLADRADNAGGGAASDSSFLLRAVLDRGMTDVAIALMWDPVAVDLCHRAGVGARIALRVGGKTGPQSGDPVDLEAEVLAIRTDATQAWFGVGEPVQSIGWSAAVRCRGVTVILNTDRQQAFSRHIFTQHGIEPADMRVLIVKSTAHFQNDFGKIAGRIVLCDAPGTVTSDLATLAYTRIRRPVWPLDPAPPGPPSDLYIRSETTGVGRQGPSQANAYQGVES